MNLMFPIPNHKLIVIFSKCFNMWLKVHRISTGHSGNCSILLWEFWDQVQSGCDWRGANRVSTCSKWRTEWPFSHKIVACTKSAPQPPGTSAATYQPFLRCCCWWSCGSYCFLRYIHLHGSEFCREAWLHHWCQSGKWKNVCSCQMHIMHMWYRVLQELLAHGITNFVCSNFRCYMMSVSLSRSLVQENVGGVTQIAGLVAALLMLVVLLALAGLFEALPSVSACSTERE